MFNDVEACKKAAIVWVTMLLVAFSEFAINMVITVLNSVHTFHLTCILSDRVELRWQAHT